MKFSSIISAFVAVVNVSARSEPALYDVSKIIEKEELVLIKITKEEGKNWLDNYQPTRRYKRSKNKKSKYNGKSFKCPQGF